MKRMLFSSRLVYLALLLCAVMLSRALPANEFELPGDYDSLVPPDFVMDDPGDLTDWFRGKMAYIRDMMCPDCLKLCRTPSTELDPTSVWNDVLTANPWVNPFSSMSSFWQTNIGI